MYNKNITGMSLLGTVKATDRETIEIDLDIDNGKSSVTYPYSWVPHTGNMMYCMPQIGTRVTLLIPRDNEQEAIATGCLRDNGATCSAMSDPGKRSFSTEHGKNLLLHPNNLSFTDSIGTVSLTDNDETLIHSNKKFLMVARDGITLKAPIIRITSPGEIQLLQTSEAEITLDRIEPAGTRSNPPTGYAGIIIRDGQIEIKSSKGSIIRATFYGNPYAPFDDAPVRGKLAFWGPVLSGILGGIALVAVAVVFGAAIIATGGILGVALVGAMTLGGLSIFGMGVSDLLRGEAHSIEEYGKVLLKGAVTGAVIGPLFYAAPLAGAAIAAKSTAAGAFLVAAKPVATKLFYTGVSLSVTNYVNDIIHAGTGKNHIAETFFGGNLAHYDIYRKAAGAVALLAGGMRFMGIGAKAQLATQSSVTSSAAKVFDNGKLNIEAVKRNPDVFRGKTADDIANMLKSEGYDVTMRISSKSSTNAEIIIINNHSSIRSITQVQISPGGGRHGQLPYIKISTSDQGIIKIIDGPKSLYIDQAEKATLIFTRGD